MVKCQICGDEMKVISWKHLKKHNLSVQQYKEQFPGSPTSSEQSQIKKKQGAIRANASRVGVPRSDEIKRKIGESKRDNPVSAWNKGIPKTEEQKLQLSISRKAKFATGEMVHWNTGRVTPENTKQKISQTLLSQNRVYTNESKRKRELTLQAKYSKGWIHPSSLRRGIPLSLTEAARRRISDASKRSNAAKKLKSHERIRQHLAQHNLEIINISENNYLIEMKCQTCGSEFARTSSVLSPYKYSMYEGKYCPVCYPPEWGYFSTHFFDANPEKKSMVGVLYLAQAANASENFLKIGITTRTAESRLLHECYQFNVIFELSMPIYDAYQIEQHVLTNINRYISNHKFGGHTECIQLSEYNRVLSLIDEKMIELNIPIRIVATGTEI